MKKRILLIALMIVYGCSSGINEDKIREEIGNKRDQIAKLQTEIRGLEQKIEKNGLTETEFKILVSVKKINGELFEHFHNVNGVVEALRQAYISPELGGTIKSINVVEGQRVKKNELLVVINSGVIKSTISELESSTPSNVPPATRTRPSESSVAVCLSRELFILPVISQLFLTGS